MVGGERRWVWVTGPGCYLDEDGRPDPELDPTTGYATANRWTCHRDTRAGDLAVLYRAKAARDVAYLFEAGSDATPLPAGSRRRHACAYRSLARLPRPVPIAGLRADPATATWPALRSGFVGSAMAVPDGVWSRLLPMAGLDAEGVERLRGAARADAATEARVVAGCAAGGLGHRLAWEREVPCPGRGAADLVGFRADGAPALVVDVRVGRAGAGAVGHLRALVEALDPDGAHAVRGLLVAGGSDERARRAVDADPRLGLRREPALEPPALAVPVVGGGP